MEVFVASIILPRPREASFEYLRRPANFLKMLPADAAHNLDVKLPQIMDVGEQLEFHVKAFGMSIQIVHDVTAVSLHERIAVQQSKGPFKAWIHEQKFTDTSNGETLLTNTIQFLPPGGMLGFVVTKKAIHSNLEQWIHHGQDLLRKAFEAGDADLPEGAR